MAKTNISFNNKNYNIDESALATATNALKSHLSTTMNGTGATIKLGGQSYSIDSAKLSAATNAFVSHLGTVSGSGYKVKVNDVEYSVASSKMTDAIGELEAVLGSISGSGDVVVVLSECQPEYDETLNGFTPMPIENVPSLVVGETYTVNWNGTAYTCVAQDLSVMGPGVIALGDISEVTGGQSTGEPFAAVSADMGNGVLIQFTPLDYTPSFTVSVTCP